MPLALLAACGGSPATQVQGPPVPASGGGAPPAPATTEATAPATPAAAAAGTDSVRDLVSNQEVERRAAALFGQLPTAPADSADAAAALAAGDVRATWDIDVRSYETHQRVEMWVNVFTGRLREYMQRTMSRGTRYEAFLRRRFREGGLPEDMTYLALIESAYNPHAYSRAAAVGMWQFMTPTARGVGMRVDHWVDERRDPVRATEGAIDFLTDLHEAYGSWYLAAAAYNGGPGRVSRGLARFADEIDDAEGDDRFFALAEQKYLPRETKDYVPKLIAAALVAKEPLRYGLTVDTQPAFAYDSVMVAGGVPLASIARAAGVTLDRVTDLNPQFLRGVTPPGEDTEVRIPAGTREAFGPAFLRLAESEKRGWRELRLDAPTSVTAIADDAGIPLRSLRWYNPRLAVDRRGRVRAGTMLRIPTVDALAAARDVPDPSLERYRRVASAPEVALVSQRHRVRRGETLGAIARRYGVSVSQLRAMNTVPGGRVRSGQVLVVRRPSRAAVARARRSLAASNARGGTRCTNQVVRVKGKRRTVRRCAAVRSSVAAREDGGGASGSRCTSRVIRSKGKTRTVRRCVAVREGAASARAGSARTGKASTGRSSTSRDARPSGKAKRKAKSARSAAGSTSARRAPR
ncbi:MAG: transglycosylase SLT domain-containing protein [Gemmatimonadaceae bacterium]|nr:transglycosylase SLT domain-containing protein [Gemmatimonadaceae bacterium]